MLITIRRCVLWFVVLACGLVAAAQHEPGDQAPRKTVKQHLAGQQAQIEERVSPRDNFFNYLPIYMTSPEFRDAAYQEEARVLGIDAAADEIPYYRHWFSFMIEELTETKAIRAQHDKLMKGLAPPDQVPAVKDWLDSVGPALDALTKAAVCEYLVVPVNPDLTLLRSFRDSEYIANEFTEIVSSFSARSMYALASGDMDQAVADCIAADRIFKLKFQLNQYEIIDDAPRIASQCFHVLQHLLKSKQLTPEHLERLAKQWSSQANGLSPADIMDQHERLLLIDYFERVASGEEKQPSFLLDSIFSLGGRVTNDEREGWDWMVRHELLDTDLAIAQVNKRYDELVSVLTRSKDFPQAIEVLQEAGQVMRKRMASMRFLMAAYGEKSVPAGMTAKQYSDRLVDGMLALLMHPNRVLDGPVAEAEYNAIQRFGQIMIALRRYEKDNAAFPGKLSELIPAYLARLPMDPFNKGQAIQYARSITDGVTTLKLKCPAFDEDGEGYAQRAELVIK